MTEQKTDSDKVMKEIRELGLETEHFFHDIVLSEYQVLIIKEHCESAGYKLGYEDDRAVGLKKAYEELLEARQDLEEMKGYELPSYTAKKVDEKDSGKADARIDKDIERAQECITQAIDWCDLESSDPNAQSLANSLDQALEVIVDAQAVLNSLKSSTEDKEK